VAQRRRPPAGDRRPVRRIADQVVGNYGAPTVKILGRRVYVLGASDAKAEKVIRGLTVAGAYVDEVTTIPEEFFTQLLGRMSVAGAQLFGTTNPDNPAHWLKAKFLDRLLELPDWRRFQFTARRQPVAARRLRRVDQSASTPASGTGGSSSASGSPPRARSTPCGTPTGTSSRTPSCRTWCGCSPSASTTAPPTPPPRCCSASASTARLYLVDEWRHDPKQTNVQLTDAQLSARSAAGCPARTSTSARPRREPRHVEWVAVDPAAASLKLQLHRDGVHGLANAVNDVAYGIRTVATGLVLRVAARVRPVRGFITEAPGYSWDPKATEKGEDKPAQGRRPLPRRRPVRDRHHRGPLAGPHRRDTVGGRPPGAAAR
jgi:hypothetical protein